MTPVTFPVWTGDGGGGEGGGLGVKRSRGLEALCWEGGCGRWLGWVVVGGVRGGGGVWLGILITLTAD